MHEKIKKPLNKDNGLKPATGKKPLLIHSPEIPGLQAGDKRLGKVIPASGRELWPLERRVALFSGLILVILLVESALRIGTFMLVCIQEHRNCLSLRQSGTYRIMCLGESTTAGGNDSYPAYLERILNSRNKGIRFSVINKGRFGVNSDYILAQLEENLVAYKPNMVIVMMGINDYGDILYYKDIPENSNWIFKHCRTYRFLRILATNIWQNLSKHMVLATAQNKDKNPSEISSVHKIFSSEECLKLGLLYRSQGKSVLEEEVLRRGVEIDPAKRQVRSSAWSMPSQ